MLERFTADARMALVNAQEEARDHGDLMIDLHHLFLGVLRSPGEELGPTLSGLGVTAQAARAALEDMVGPGLGHPEGQLPMTDPVRRTLELTLVEALTLRDSHIGTEHLMLALMFEPHGLVLEIVLALDTTPARISEAVGARLGKPVPELRGRRGRPSGRDILQGRGINGRRGR